MQAQFACLPSECCDAFQEYFRQSVIAAGAQLDADQALITLEDLNPGDPRRPEVWDEANKAKAYALQQGREAGDLLMRAAACFM